MNSITGAGSAGRTAGVTPERERLQDAMRQLEGVFVQQLFKAMRETVPDEGIVSGGSGEEIFTSLLDERLAALVPEAWGHDGIEAALLRQFRGALPADDAASRAGTASRSDTPPGPDA
jgi:flagellar protein FlgJ